MCLALPGQIVQQTVGGKATVDMHGNKFSVSLELVPEARVGDWVLVHAGFAITKIEESDARETWALLEQGGLAEELGIPDKR
ncbi:MAG: HypC/HybG/HupF family hydrogenase formation chaperone [Phycisphaerae bacterium]|nr:HypC/HybG/HupF family hydrogenase formation chaperone [Phycisphaerae bacterium]